MLELYDSYAPTSSCSCRTYHLQIFRVDGAPESATYNKTNAYCSKSKHLIYAMRQRHLWCLLLAARAAPAQKVSRQACKPCNPQGATGTEPPPIGPEIDSLFLNVLQSVKDIRFDKRWEDQFIGENAFCCAENLDCLTVLNLNIPMCYDKFTTHYAFPGTWKKSQIPSRASANMGR
jgi:hypothetical protein